MHISNAKLKKREKKRSDVYNDELVFVKFLV